MMTPKPPESVREKVIQVLYKKFDDACWEQLSHKEKSTFYERFLEDSSIGGALGPYMDPGGIRVWIKDGPAKEYGRAIEGVGAYARYTSRSYPNTTETVTKVLGCGWSAVDGSVEEKPMRCLAESQAGDRRFLVWGAVSSIKELAWAIIRHRIKDADTKAVLVVTRMSIAPLQTSDQKLATAVAEVIGADFKTVVRQAVKKT